MVARNRVLSTITIAVPDPLNASRTERMKALGARSKEEYLLALAAADCAASELDRTLTERLAGPFVPRAGDWKEQVREAAAGGNLLRVPILQPQASRPLELVRVAGHQGATVRRANCGNEHVVRTDPLTLLLQFMTNSGVVLPRSVIERQRAIKGYRFANNRRPSIR